MLTLIFDHRFLRDRTGTVTSPKHYDYHFFVSRYGQVFDGVRIVARVRETDPPAKNPPTEGPGVEVISVGDWRGLAAVLPRVGRLIRIIHREVDQAACVSIIGPGMLGSIAALWCARAKRPYGLEVVTDPDDMFAPGATSHPLRPLIRQVAVNQLRRDCERAAVVLYVTGEALQRRYPTRGLSVGVSDARLGPEAFASVEEHEKGLNGVRTVWRLIHVGTYHQHYKAQDVLLKAFAACVDRGLSVELVLVGDGPLRAREEQRARTLGVAGRVRFTGELPAGEPVRRELDAAQLFVMPSRQEGLPRAMLEAMARGLPCIGSTVGGIPELLPPSALVPPNDVAALSRKIEEVLTNHSFRRELSFRCYATAQNYAESRTLSKRHNAYRALADMSRKRTGCYRFEF